MPKKNSKTKVRLTGNTVGAGQDGNLATVLRAAMKVEIDLNSIFADVAASLPMAEKVQADELNAAARELNKEADDLESAFQKRMQEVNEALQKAENAYRSICARVEHQTFEHYNVALRSRDWTAIKATALLAKGNCEAEEKDLKLKVQKAVEAVLMGEITQAMNGLKLAKAALAEAKKSNPREQVKGMRELAKRQADEASLLIALIKGEDIPGEIVATGDANNG